MRRFLPALYVIGALLTLVGLIDGIDIITAVPAAGQAPSSAIFGISAGSGNVSAATATATLPASPSRTTYLCGFMVTGSGATAGSSVAGSVTNLTNALTFDVGVPAGATVPLTPVVVSFPVCLPSSQPNQTIVVSVPSFGTGNLSASVIAWGYQLQQ